MLEELGDQFGLMWCKAYMGEMEFAEARDEAGLRRAEAILLESLEIAQKLGNKFWLSYQIPVLIAGIAQKLGEYAQAISLLRGVLNLFQNLGTNWLEDQLYEVGQCFLGLAEALVCLDQPAFSASLLGALEGLREHAKGWWKEITDEKVKRVSDLTRSRLAEADFQVAWEEGRAQTLEQAMAYALEPSANIHEYTKPDRV